MLYTLEQGQTEKLIIQQCMREGRSLPGAISNAPELIRGLELYYLAYTDLQSCRQNGMQEGKISWLSVNEYCLRNGFSEEQHDDLQHFVMHLDAAYLDFRGKKAEKERKMKSNKEPAPGSRVRRRR